MCHAFERLGREVLDAATAKRDPYFSAPGFALARLISRFTLLTGRKGCVISSAA